MKVTVIIWVFSFGMVTAGLIDRTVDFAEFGFFIGFWTMVASCIGFWVQYLLDL